MQHRGTILIFDVGMPSAEVTGRTLRAVGHTVSPACDRSSAPASISGQMPAPILFDHTQPYARAAGLHTVMRQRPQAAGPTVRMTTSSVVATALDHDRESELDYESRYEHHG